MFDFELELCFPNYTMMCAFYQTAYKRGRPR